MDFVSRLLFYVDAGHKTISACSLDGKTRFVILERLSDPFDIVVDPHFG